MSKRHTIYLIFDVGGAFLDACLSYSEASLIASRNGPGCTITRRDAEDY
jgi:hypothetical protein